MFAFEHSAGGFGTPDTLTLDYGRSRGPISLHNAIDYSYGQYADSVKVASFAEGRMDYREWARRSGRLEFIHSIDDRFDHDIDELMA